MVDSCVIGGNWTVLIETVVAVIVLGQISSARCFMRAGDQIRRLTQEEG
jgi:hypothetical protein